MSAPSSSALRVVRFAPALRGDFLHLHSSANGAGWCRCVAWWVPTWEGWGDRTAEDNAALRDRLCESGEYDGYLAYAHDEPVGWCQAGRRDRLAKLVGQLVLAPDPATWAITCLLVAPAWRGRGVAHALVAGALADMRRRGAKRVEAYPRSDGLETTPEDVWTGPSSLFRAAGFTTVRPGLPRDVVALELG